MWMEVTLVSETPPAFREMTAEPCVGRFLQPFIHKAKEIKRNELGFSLSG